MNRYYPRPSEHFLSTRKDVIKGILKMRRRLSKFATHLEHVFFIALLNLIFEELLERAVPESFLALLGEIRDQVGYQGSCEALRLRMRIIGEKRVDWRARWRARDLCRSLSHCGRCRGRSRVR